MHNVARQMTARACQIAAGEQVSVHSQLSRRAKSDGGLTAKANRLLCTVLGGIPSPSSLNLSPERFKTIKIRPMPHINLFVCTPLGCYEGVVDIIYDVTLPEGEYRGLGLRHILGPHTATNIPRLQVDILHQPPKTQ